MKGALVRLHIAGGGARAQVTAAMIRDPATAADELLVLNGDISYARGWAWIWERCVWTQKSVARLCPRTSVVERLRLGLDDLGAVWVCGSGSAIRCALLVPHHRSGARVLGQS